MSGELGEDSPLIPGYHSGAKVVRQYLALEVAMMEPKPPLHKNSGLRNATKSLQHLPRLRTDSVSSNVELERTLAVLGANENSKEKWLTSDDAPAIRHLFSALDANGDNDVSVIEFMIGLRVVMSHLGPNFEHSAPMKLFTSLNSENPNKEKTGSLSVEHFVARVLQIQDSIMNKIVRAVALDASIPVSVAEADEEDNMNQSPLRQRPPSHLCDSDNQVKVQVKLKKTKSIHDHIRDTMQSFNSVQKMSVSHHAKKEHGGEQVQQTKFQQQQSNNIERVQELERENADLKQKLAREQLTCRDIQRKWDKSKSEATKLKVEAAAAAAAARQFAEDSDHMTEEDAPYDSVEAALADGKTQEEVDAWLFLHSKGSSKEKAEIEEEGRRRTIEIEEDAGQERQAGEGGKRRALEMEEERRLMVLSDLVKKEKGGGGITGHQEVERLRVRNTTLTLRLKSTERDLRLMMEFCAKKMGRHQLLEIAAKLRRRSMRVPVGGIFAERHKSV